MKSGQYCVDAMRGLTNYAEEQVVSSHGKEFQAIFQAENLTAREFMFYFADVLVFSVQYGSRSQFCESVQGKTLEEQF